MVSASPSLCIRQGVITGNAAGDCRPTDVGDRRLLVEAQNGSSKEPRNSGIRLLEK